MIPPVYYQKKDKGVNIMRFKRKDFKNFDLVKTLSLFAIIILLLSGCAGTFRTADVLNEGEKTMTVSLPFASLTDPKLFVINPDISYRQGIGHRTDLGIKVYLIGAEFSACRNILKEGKFNPAIALQLTTGMALYDGVIVEPALLISKKIGVISLYSGIKYKSLTDVSGFYYGRYYRKFLYTAGIQLPENNGNKIYIEIYNAPIAYDPFGEYPYFSEHVLIGVGAMFKIGH